MYKTYLFSKTNEKIVLAWSWLTRYQKLFFRTRREIVIYHIFHLRSSYIVVFYLFILFMYAILFWVIKGSSWSWTAVNCIKEMVAEIRMKFQFRVQGESGCFISRIVCSLLRKFPRLEARYHVSKVLLCLFITTRCNENNELFYPIRRETL